MKATTAIEKRVMQLYETLKNLPEDAIGWSQKHLDCFYTISRNKIHCMECGHKMIGDAKLLVNILNVTCPSCNNDLTSARPDCTSQYDYFSLITTCKEFQLIRIFETKKNMKRNSAARYHSWEVLQLWINESGVTTTIRRKLRGYGGYSVCGFENSPLDLHTYCNIDYSPKAVYPKQKILPTIRRNGFKGRFHNIKPDTLFRAILTDHKAETLLKAKQFSVLKRFCENKTEGNRYWASIKICLRNRYIIKNAGTWIDYLGMLDQDGKDILNAKYICPNNLAEQHNKIVAKMQKLHNKRNIEQLAAKQTIYEVEKKKFFNLILNDDNLIIKPIKSINQLKKESEKLEHCAYVNNYYKKKESLLLSARIDGNVVETVEVSLKTFEIIQARGLRNTASEYNGRIVQLVSANMQLIKAKSKGQKNMAKTRNGQLQLQG